MDTQTYYAKIRETREELAKQNPQGFCLVISVANLEKNSTAGTPCEVSLYDAARLMTDGTHRVANEKEADAYRNRQEAERVRIAQENLERARVQFSNIMGVTTANLPTPKAGK